MTLKNLVGFLILIGFCSCTDNTDFSNSQTILIEKLPSGFSIKNGPRQGSRYVDSNGTTYVYIHITTTITNDSTIPMRLAIDFSEKKNLTNDSLKSTGFLLPRRRLTSEKLLTPLSNQIDLGITNELKWFLDRFTEIPVSLDTVLNSKGKCILTFGLLNNTKYELPYGIGLKASTESSSTVNLGLSFDRMPSEHYLIPCGQISFTSDKK